MGGGITQRTVNMKNTIKAKDGYVVRHTRYPLNPRGDKVYVLDGEHLLFKAKERSMDDYIDEYKDGNNECAVKYEVFTTVKGNQFIYWGDTETGEDFITKVVA